MMAVKPSIIAASAVIFGLFAAYHLKDKKAKAKQSSTVTPTSTAPNTQQPPEKQFPSNIVNPEEKDSYNFTHADMRTVNFAWNELSLSLLEGEDACIKELEDFMGEISERLSYICHKYGSRLVNIFSP